MRATIGAPDSGVVCAGEWSTLDVLERRHLAEQACRQGDLEALCSLTGAYLALERGEGSQVSRHTLRAYRRGVCILLEHWSGEAVLHPPDGAATDLVRELERSGASPATVKVYLASMRALYQALGWAGVCQTSPFLNIRPTGVASSPSVRRQMYGQEERDALLSRADAVDRVMILLCASGLRVSECVSLRWPDVDLEAEQVRVREADGTERMAPLSAALVTELRALPTNGSDRVLRFATEVRARRRMQRLCERAGVPYRGLQALRGSGVLDPPPSTSGVDVSWRPELAEHSRGRQHNLIGEIPDQRTFEEELAQAVVESRKSSTWFGLVTIQLSAQRDAQVDEAIIRTVAGRLNRLRRPSDVLAYCPVRYFCLIMKDMPSGPDLGRIFRRFWRALNSDPVEFRGQRHAIEANIGVAMFPDEALALLRDIDLETGQAQLYPSRQTPGNHRF